MSTASPSHRRRAVPSKRNWAALLVATFLWVVGMGTAQAQSQQDLDVIRRGELRADLWMFYQKNDPDDSNLYKWVLRLQRPWFLPDDWKISWRFDLPFLYTNSPGSENPNGHYQNGLGDLFGQVAVTTPQILPNLTINFGFRMVAPTGGKSPFGSSQWKAAPQVGFAWERELAPGIFLEVAPMVRYFRGFGTLHAGTTTTRDYDVYPTIGLRLPDDWTIFLWDENSLTYGARANAWFVPFDIMVTKRIYNSFQLGFGAAVKLIDDYPQYKYMIYGRGSYSF